MYNYMNKIFKTQEEIYIPRQPKENHMNDNQRIEKDYNSIRKLVIGNDKTNIKNKISYV